MNPENTNNWKSYVDWWPTYIVIGITLTYFVHQTEIVQKLTEKIFTKKNEEENH